MSVCYIVGAGDNRATSFMPGKGDFVIAADGGLSAVREMGLEPDLILGDFDSLGYVLSGGNTVRHPTHKDETDLMLACREGLARGYTDFRLYGVLGGARISHTVANLQLLRWLADQGARGRLYGCGCELFILRDETVWFSAQERGFLSLFALSETAVVSIVGAEYELEKAVLVSSYPLGVSNTFCGRETTVTAHAGDLLVITEKSS